jgi:hypothetical protein
VVQYALTCASAENLGAVLKLIYNDIVFLLLCFCGSYFKLFLFKKQQIIQPY